MISLSSFSPARPSARQALVLSLLVFCALLWCVARPAASFADACTPPVTSAVACENTKAGTDPEIWQTTGAGDSDLQGFATQMSVNKGTTVNFKIKSTVGNAYKIDIYRLGYYQGNGARLMQGGITPSGSSTQSNPCLNNTTGLVDCGNWTVSSSWAVPSTAVSGVYVAHLVRNDGDGDSQIIFVVRDDASTSKLLLQTSDATWQAYNSYGGNNLYDCTVNCPDGNPRAYKAAYKVSYNRPLGQPYDGVSSLFDGAEYSMIRFLERNGYDMSYTSSSDLGRAPALLLNHKVFISSGHDEYWSASQRSAVEAARAAGVSLAFFSGNEMFWKTRWEPSIDGSNTANRTLVTYKDTHFDARVDPVEWTGSWYDPRFTTAGDGVTPQNAVTGQSFTVNAGTTSLTVPAAYGKLRLWRNTAAASLTGSQVLTLSPATLGYEWDVDADNGYRPAGQVKLSATTASGLDVFTDYGTTVVPGGTATHNLTMYKTSSGARVFGAGTVQWAFGLDSPNPGGGVANLTMQQATANLFADMGAQPVTPMSGLLAATASTDTTAPTATVGTLVTTVADGTKVTITGTAADVGGQVAGIEVTTDGGASWHPATSGTTSWTYTWVAHGAAAKVQARATDDSGNIGAATAAKTVAVTCPCSLFGTNVTPVTADVDGGDASPIEVGFKFQSDTYGTVKGVRFYKATANTGTHIGNLWAADGTRLASATFTGESASGWQTVTFSTPVQVTPNTTYVASYYTPTGHYSATNDYWYKNPAPGPNGGATADATPLHAVRATSTTANGLYAYGGASAFPTNTFGAPNYWVDVVFEATPAPNPVTAVTALAGGKTSAVVKWTSPSTGGPITSYKITPYVGTTAKPATTIAGTAALTQATVTGLTTGTTYTFTVTPSNPGGAAAESAKSNAVTPLTAVAPGPPGSVTADPGNAQGRVNWTAPDTDGDSAITGYVVTPYVGATAGTPVSVGAAARTATVTGLANGTATTFRVAAVNGVGTGTTAASGEVTPGATLMDFTTPSIVDSGDPDPVELGVKFKADSGGTISGLRFYKAATNIGQHVGTLWSSTGTILARATFTDETASGWQDVQFSAPVTVTAGTIYVASYYTPSGHYSLTSHGLDNAIDAPPLHALGTGTSPNGVFVYAGAPTFPTGTYGASNYFVDVLYAVAKPGQPTGASAVAGSGQATVSWTAPASGGTPTSYVVTPYIGATAQTATTVNSPSATSATVTGLTAGTSYTFKVQASNSAGAGTASAATNAVTPTSASAPSTPTNVVARPADSSVRLTWTAAVDGGSPLTKYTVTPYIGATAQTSTDVSGSTTSTTLTGLTDGTAYTFRVTATNAIGTSPASTATAAVTPQETIFGFATPGTVDGGDGSGIEVGVKFRSSVHGAVTGIRFYKADTNTGTHIGSLWSAFGTRLGTATFTNESSSGWQTVTFSSPVTITPDTTYVASYYAPSGHYSVNGPGLASAVTDAPLTALADATSQNGVYAYGGASAFPSSSYNASNYWVDVLYAPLADPDPVTGVSATAGPGNATVSWTAPSGGTAVDSYKITPYVGTTAQPSTTISAPATSTTIIGLTPGTSYTFKVQDRNVDGSGPTSAASNAVTPTSNAVPAAPTGVAAVPATSSARVTWTAPSGSVTGYTVTPYDGATAGTPATASGSATSTVVTGLTNGTAYTFKVVASNGQGDGTASSASNAVTPAATIFDFATPATIDGGDNSSIVLGAKFTADTDGWITGIRFYKAAANTGTHIGALYSIGGSVLAQATFAGESDSGWQTAYFASPQAVTAGTTYVATYLAPNGHYSVTGAAFATATDHPPLHALSDATSPNGVYAYSSDLTFPASNFNATNYFVDVLFSSSS
ncbi:MAG TPA: DUF4082 domain-containing protein [Baekduia sp.]|nr:DUF4082 domain-containing protein [Baekduia sp.]